MRRLSTQVRVQKCKMQEEGADIVCSSRSTSFTANQHLTHSLTHWTHVLCIHHPLRHDSCTGAAGQRPT